MNREEIRMELDDIDELLVDLFARRMGAAREMAAYKKEHNLPVRDRAREEEKLRVLSVLVSEEMRPYLKRLYETLFTLSRDYQEQLIKDML